MDRLPRLTLLISLAMTALAIHPLAAQVRLEYRHQEGDQWHLTSEIVEEVLQDDQVLGVAEILNKISAEIVETEGSDGSLYNRYSIAEYRPDIEVYVWAGEFEADYSRSRQGYISGLSENAVVPSVRNVPVFPDRLLFPGDTWTSYGTEILDLNVSWGLPLVLQIDFQALYTYNGTAEVDGRILESITIEYQYEYAPDRDELEVMREYLLYPNVIFGDFHQELFWDNAAGRAFSEEGYFSHIFIMNDNHTYTYQGTSRGQAVYVDELDREALVGEIEDLGLEDITAEIVDDGVKISLENINFYPDEPVMLPGQEGKLKEILDVLRRYPDRDIQVVGHTARIAGGSDGQVLSERRAGAVAGVILDSGVRTRDRLTIRGMGNRRPIGDNSTEEGRRLNRRVEIIILEN